MTREMGKVLTEARGDVQEAIDMGKFIAGEGRRAYGETVPSELRDKWAMTMRQPFGVIGCITPWNFPIAIPSWKIFPAVMAGNAVVIKPAEDTPLCALRFVEALEACGTAGGRRQRRVRIRRGGGRRAGRSTPTSPRSTSRGASTPAGSCPRRAAGCSRSARSSSVARTRSSSSTTPTSSSRSTARSGERSGPSGQRCTASSRLIVEHGALDGFTSRLVERASAAAPRRRPRLEGRRRAGHQRDPAQAHPFVHRDRTR